MKSACQKNEVNKKIIIISSIALSHVVEKEINENYKRREFKEFSYLSVEPSLTAIIITFVLSILINVGLSIYIITNEFNNTHKKY